jgi:hypothetical protein
MSQACTINLRFHMVHPSAVSEIGHPEGKLAPQAARNIIWQAAVAGERGGSF